jgi:cation diffusion facilitator family transporter
MSTPVHEHAHERRADHDHGHGHGHSHGPFLDTSITRSRAGVRAVSLSLGILLVTAVLQAFVYLATSSVALLVDLLHNAGDALTAVPLGAAFLLRSRRAEHVAGFFVVGTIFISALSAAVFAIYRIIHPLPIQHLLALGLAGLAGFIGNEIAAAVRVRAGRRLNSPALIADGQHARVDGLVSLAVVGSALVVALGLHIADPIIGLVITFVILKITWESFHTVKTGPERARRS